MSENTLPVIAPEPAEVAAHTILVRRGTYCIHVISSSPNVTVAQLPGLAVSAAPGEENSAVEIARLSGEPWLRQPGDALLVRVHTEQVRLLLTSYNTLRDRGAAPPRVEIQRLGATAAAVVPAPVLETARAVVPDVIVHVRNRGDQRGAFGEWVGDQEENLWLEGFTIAAPDGLEPADLQYQAVFGKGWSSPWVDAGAYCGSRGLQLPILGLRLRLSPEAEKRFKADAEAMFADGSTMGPVGAGTVCAADPLQPVTSIRVMVSVREEPARSAPAPKLAPAKEPPAAKEPAARAGWRRAKR